MPPRVNRNSQSASADRGGDRTPTPERNRRAPPLRPCTLPPFQSRDVKFWFMQAEAMFRTNKITDDQTKFDLVLTSLDITAATDISDILETPPETDMYVTLKTALIGRLATSEAARIKQILSSEELGTRKPSQHLRHLQKLAGKNFSDQALTSIWLESLPADVRIAVVTGRDLPLDKQAEMADHIIDISGKTRSVHAIESTTTVEKQIAALTKQISALTKRLGDKSSGRPDDAATKAKHPRSKSPARQQSSTSGSDLCYYHQRYKEKAKKCRSPCNWTGSRPSSPGNDEDQQ